MSKILLSEILKTIIQELGQEKSEVSMSPRQSATRIFINEHIFDITDGSLRLRDANDSCFATFEWDGFDSNIRSWAYDDITPSMWNSEYGKFYKQTILGGGAVYEDTENVNIFFLWITFVMLQTFLLA